MGKPKNFVIVDEKPKRGHEEIKRQPILRMRVIALGIITLAFSLLFLGYVTCFGALHCDDYPWDLELTSTSIVRTNEWVMRMLTGTHIAMTDISLTMTAVTYETPIITWHPTVTPVASEGNISVTETISYNASTPAPQRTLQAIQWQQTQIAATQEGLVTLQAQTILTLTAVATGTP